MIVKVRCDEKWIMYDGIEKISWERFPNATKQDCNVLWFGQKSNSPDEFVTLITRQADKEFVIQVNQDVYICNDKGETIEKIN